jgi:hypothetical protein
MCLWLSIDEINALAELYGALRIVMVFVGLCAGVAIVFTLWRAVDMAAARFTSGLRHFSVLIGLAAVFAAWADVGHVSSIIVTALGIALPPSLIAAAAGIVLVSATTMSETRTDAPPSIGMLATWCLALTLAGLANPGGIAEFVYEGF